MLPPLSRIQKVRTRHYILYLTLFIIMPIITYLLGKWFDTTLQLPPGLPFPHNLLIGFTIFFSGLTIGIRATRQLQIQGFGLPWGEFHLPAQTTRLVTDGFYAYCRNPVTLGYSLLPCGMGVMFQSLGMSILIPLLILLSNIIWLKGWEEPNLEQRFGNIYHKYKDNTPFLLPRFPPSIKLDALKNLVQGRVAPSPHLIYVLYTSLSILGAIFLILLAYNASLPFVHIPYQETIITVCFDVICLAGIFAGIYPTTCSQIISKSKVHSALPSSPLQKRGKSATIQRHSHHPDCQPYASHILQLRGINYCGGCLGLVIGAIFALLSSIPLFFSVTLSHGEIWLWVGSGFLIIGILQHQFSSFNNSWLHLILNVVFVIGPFFQLVGLFNFSPSLIAELYLLLMVLFWIVTRISLSRLQHAKICQTCNESCTDYSR